MSGSSPDQIAKELTKILSDYSELATDEVRDIITDVGNEAKNRVTEASPKGHGKYRRGWTVRAESSGSKVSIIVHNRRYQLTHLLENGHRTRYKTGRYGSRSRAAARPHIGDVNSWAQEEVEKRIRAALGGGNT